MPDTTLYRQCELWRKRGNATDKRLVWIPEKFATLARVLKLRNDDGEWIDEWLVNYVSEQAVEGWRLLRKPARIENGRGWSPTQELADEINAKLLFGGVGDGRFLAEN